MKTILDKIRKWRLIGYLLIGVALYQRGFEVEVLVIEMFLLILLTELSVRGIQTSTPHEYKKKLGTKNDSVSKEKR